MTRREKSDAQLDAEAEARRRNLDPPEHEHGFDDPDAYAVPRFPSSEPPTPAPDPKGLALLVELHRAMWRDDNMVPRLTSRQPPLTRYEKNDWFEGDPERYGANQDYVIEQGARVGMSMSGNMIRRLSESPGASFPWVTALGRLRQDCRRLHPHHRSAERPYWRGALCWQVVYLVVVQDLSPENAARVLRLEEIEPLLRRTLRDMENGIDYFRRRAERRATEDAGMGPGPVPQPKPTHHVVPGLHEKECPQCRRKRAAA